MDRIGLVLGASLQGVPIEGVKDLLDLFRNNFSQLSAFRSSHSP